jgi:hypothetical protein
MALTAFPRLGEVPARVLENHFVRDVFTVPKRDYDWGVQGRVQQPEIAKLDEAHVAAEKLYGFCILSCVNRALRKSLAPQKTVLRDRVVELVSQVHDHNSSRFSNGGSSDLRQCVETGNYLFVLKIYFMARPTALRNHVGEKNSEGHGLENGYGRTILHSAVSPDSGRPSLSFVRFVIQMDARHNLGMHLMIDKHNGGQLPLEACRHSVESWKALEKRGPLQAVERMLIEASPEATKIADEAAAAAEAAKPKPEPVIYIDDRHGRPIRTTQRELDEMKAHLANLPPLPEDGQPPLLPLDDGDDDEEPSCISRFCSYIGEMFTSIFECFRSLFAR